MSTLAELGDAIKAFVYNNSGFLDILPGETGEPDMNTKLDAAILVAVNNARLFAEKQHDFAFTKVDVPVTLDSSGVNIYSLGADNIKMKKIVGVDLVSSGGGTRPMLFTTEGDLRVRRRIADRLMVEDRYPSYSPNAVGHEPQMVLKGLTLNSFPVLSSGQTMDVIVSGYKWLNRYTVLDTTTDWLIDVGFDFMMWQAIIEVNHIVNIFVPRQEGSLAPPEKLRDEALASLIIADTDLENFYAD